MLFLPELRLHLVLAQPTEGSFVAARRNNCLGGRRRNRCVLVPGELREEGHQELPAAVPCEALSVLEFTGFFQVVGHVGFHAFAFGGVEFQLLHVLLRLLHFLRLHDLLEAFERRLLVIGRGLRGLPVMGHGAQMPRAWSTRRRLPNFDGRCTLVVRL